jgi:transposase
VGQARSDNHIKGITVKVFNHYVGIIDEQDQRLYQKRLTNRLEHILEALDPIKESLEGVVVESTYNWYWLVDGLQDEGYKVHLANPSAIKQYEGLKHTDDKWDSFWLAHMKRMVQTEPWQIRDGAMIDKLRKKNKHEYPL